MTQDLGDLSAELARLLRRIDELDGPQQPRLPAAPSLDPFEMSTMRPLSDPNERSNALTTQSDPRLQPQRASKSRKPVAAIAIVVAATALVAVVLAVKMPSISIVVVPDGESKFRVQTLARTPPDADMKAEPQQPVAANQSKAETTATVAPPPLPTAIDLTPVKPARPQVVASEKTPLQRDQVWPLGANITIEGGGTLVVRGLAAGAKLSAGQPLDSDGWELGVADLSDAIIAPPRGFVGAMDLTLALRRDGAASDPQSLHVEWAGEAAVAPVSTVRLGPSDVTRLLMRGEELMANREIAAARAVFKRLADSGEQRGAFALAETYEQSTLERLGAKGLLPEMAAARAWYERAKALGSTEAQNRLDLLAARNQ